jgi:hypothetical protein
VFSFACFVLPHIRTVQRFEATVLGAVVLDSRSGCVETGVRSWRVLAGPSPAYTFFVPIPITTMESSKQNQKPVDQRTLGGVTVAIFANQAKGRDVPLYKVSTKRTYVRNSEYVTVTSLFRDDLPVVSYLHQWAWVRIYELQREWRQKHGAKTDASEEGAEVDAAEDVAE